jgi:fructose-1,6-bisphosphatase/inositol monophosphatase family enzyme
MDLGCGTLPARGIMEGMPALDVDVVSALVMDVVHGVILPRFRSLDPGDVEQKSSPADPDDVVTIVDRQAEQALTRALRAIAPEAAVIGEEAAHADPGMLDLLARDHPVWVLDPIDGTRNFVAGHDSFGIMLAYISQGVTRAAWVCLPARSELYVAELGGGAYCNGTRVSIPSDSTPEVPNGTVHTRFMPSQIRSTIAQCAGRFVAQHDAHSAAVEYAEILRGRRDFAVYYRLLPWDHAAPGLMVAEGGGWSGHLDGTPYSPRSSDQVTIVASSRGLAQRISGWMRTGHGEWSRFDAD